MDYNEIDGKATTKQFNSQYNNRAEFIKCDVSNAEQLEHAFVHTVNKYHRLDIVFNNAGIGERTMWPDAIRSGSNIPGDWNSVIRIDLDAVINGTRLAVREMMKLNDNGSNKNIIGVIINTASVGGLHPMPFSPIYCMYIYIDKWILRVH